MPRDNSGSPIVEQAEAYLGDRCVVIRNEKTAKVADRARELLGASLADVADFPAFLEAVSPMVRNSKLIIAFGDSTTANFTNWPRWLARLPLLCNRKVPVLNLADWNQSVGHSLAPLEFTLHWLRQSQAGQVTVVYLGGLLDWCYRRSGYEKFMRGDIDSPVYSVEGPLGGHPYGLELARLTANVPEDHGAIDRWIARRIVIVLRLLQQVCADAGARFVAALQPLCFDDLAPAYRVALRRRYEETASPVSFAGWCRDQGYHPDLASRAASLLNLPAPIAVDTRAGLDTLSAAWRQLASAEADSFTDLSYLFRDLTESAYDPCFDAVHFSGIGSARIAETIAEFLKV
jgi:hypothetical protein